MEYGADEVTQWGPLEITRSQWSAKFSVRRYQNICSAHSRIEMKREVMQIYGAEYSLATKSCGALLELGGRTLHQIDATKCNSVPRATRQLAMDRRAALGEESVEFRPGLSKNTDVLNVRRNTNAPGMGRSSAHWYWLEIGCYDFEFF